MDEPCSPAKAEIRVSKEINREANSEKSSEITIGDIKDLASYNWLDDEPPTILVPGAPPVFTPSNKRPLLTKDTEPRFIDQNSDRYPWSPIEPAIRAIKTLNPDFAFNNVDVITDRRPLHHLFHFSRGDSNSFSFHVEVIKNTLIFYRHEHNTRDTIPEGEFQGFRQAFEATHLQVPEDVKGSTSHHRIVNYDLNGINMVVRYSVVGTCSNSDADGDPARPEPWRATEHQTAAALSRPAPEIQRGVRPPDLEVQAIGQHVGRENLFELMTGFKFAKYPRTISDRMLDVWLVGSKKYMLAQYQNAGNRFARRAGWPRLVEFADINVIDLEDRTRKWSEENADHISMFVGLLEEVIQTVRSIGQTCIVSYGAGCASLSITPVGEESLAPKLSEVSRVVFDQV